MNRVSKTMVVSLTSALLLGSVTPAFADQASYASTGSGKDASSSTLKDSGLTPVSAAITKEKAVQLAKQYVQIPDTFKLESVSFNQNSMNSGTGAWNLYYNWKENDRYRGSIYVGIDGGTGELINYSNDDNDPTKRPMYPPKVDIAAGKKIAWAFVEKIKPKGMSEVRYNEDFEKNYKPSLSGSIQYDYLYERVVNGVVFPQNNIRVTVDGNGHVIRYGYEWNSDLTFAAADGTLTAEQAREAYLKQMDPRLTYLLPYQPKAGEMQKPQLSYEFNGLILDAKTGKPDGAANNGDSGSTRISDKKLGDKPGTELQLSREEAAEVVNRAFGVPENAKLDEASYNEQKDEYGKNTANWNLRWTIPKALSDEEKKRGYDPNSYVWADVNANTGEIRNYSTQGAIIYNTAADNELKASVTYDQAKTKAMDTVKKLLPYYADELYVSDGKPEGLDQQSVKDMPSFGFSFQRKVHDAVTTMDNVNVQVDRVTGDIISYSAYIFNYNYPQQKPTVLSVDKAKERLLSAYRIQKQYVYEPVQDYSNYPIEKLRVMVAAGKIPASALDAQLDGTNKQPNQARLIYTLVSNVFTDEPFYLDAVTGEWKSRQTGGTVSLQRVVASDIGKSPAKAELQLMIDYRALDVVNGKVNPEQAVTRGEMIKMLLTAINGGPIYYTRKEKASFSDVSASSPFFSYIEAAADQNLIDRNSSTFRPDAVMTRDDMAELIVRALGLSKLAGYDKLFNIPFKDQSKVKHKGHAAIVVGLGILSLNQANFEPAKSVTRAQAAQAFVRFLQKRADLVDQPIQ